MIQLYMQEIIKDIKISSIGQKIWLHSDVTDVSTPKTVGFNHKQTLKLQILQEYRCVCHDN